MEITEAKVFLAEGGGRLRAYASIVFDGSFMVRDLKIVESDRGLFVSMPSRKERDGTFRDIVHPLTPAMRTKIEEKLIGEYNRVVGQR